MPIYEFLCPEGHLTEHWWHLADEARREVVCRCGMQACRIVSMPAFHVAETDPETGLKVFRGNPWEGTPLEDDDGINPAHYKSDKIQIDLKKK